LKKRLDKGEDFAALAKQFSEDPNAENGGDLGFIKKGTLSELAFEERAFALGTGQVSDVFETRLGFHIIKVSERQEQTVHVSQIFLKDSPPEPLMQKTMDQMDSVRTHCQSPEDFIAAVRRLSTDNQSRAANGRMGWTSLYALAGPLRAIIDSLQSGQISVPQRDGDDCILYRLDDKVSQRRLTIEDDFDLLADKAREISGQAKLINLVKRWRKDVFVDIRL
jgi:peptidyl-prolyl cis-trans isomerase SurA